ncbi:Glycosyltransferase WbsX [Algoriphagus ornithinivorans]|uniref:Glycosyltransferase WbsX n=1 Tax=Algoriphagus ornithinivorans TaxID=226506 RepID=A0A1I5H772_9BACT|nr:glycoside hydrolase family 99-like domain-containing protein [Algoriphagus ornithinivorans]SFO44102.1 Glycosyltransferase WbsX [Algoriphagus ornithinivorans]
MIPIYRPLILIFLFLAISCQVKSISDSKDQSELKSTLLENEPSSQLKQEELVGVYFMPSWDTDPDPNRDRDNFWSCLQNPEDCANLKNPAIWGPRGRVYNRNYPYEGPYLDRKPVKELKGFYKRDDKDVARIQLELMKSYGIDFFAYNWFYGRHYYYHLYFGPQSRIFYPKGWKIDSSRDGRVAVPGLEEWNEQLEILLEVNAKLPEKDQLKWAINWCDDSDDRWMNWLKIGSPDEMARKANYPGEKPTKELYLQVHEKITRRWTDSYFNRKDYLKTEDGRPIVYFYFPQDAEARAAFYGLELKDLLNLSQRIAREQGFPGIKFIAVMAGPMLERERAYGLPTKWQANNSNRPWEGGRYVNRLLLQEYVPRLKTMGFEGMTGYVYHNFFEKDNRSYADMRETYRGHWTMWSEQFKEDPNFEYQVPVAMGWDMRPAGGTWPQQAGFPSEPYKDNVHSTKSTFQAKLKEAQEVSLKYRNTKGNTIMICCWNEYLEGNHIEPTVGHGYDYLEAIREVFGGK